MRFLPLGAALGSTAILAASLFGGGRALADIIPYPHAGTENLTTYSFTATATGDVIAYFAGTGAAYTETLGMFVNGTLSSAGFGLNNHTSAIGDSFDLGGVNAGDTLVFAIDIINPRTTPYVYSDPSLNAPYDQTPVGHNHIYSVAYTATNPVFDGIPTGTYVGFEDLRATNTDWNYFDETYVFTNVSSSTSIPEPGAFTLLVSALGGLALTRRRRV